MNLVKTIKLVALCVLALAVAGGILAGCSKSNPTPAVRLRLQQQPWLVVPRVSESGKLIQTYIIRGIQGRPASESDEEPAEFDYYYMATFDRQGNRLEEDGYHPANESTYTYEYDDHGNICKSYWYDSDGSLNAEADFKYDDKGNVIEMMKRRGIDDHGVKTCRKYDKSGNLVGEDIYDYTYDSKDPLLKRWTAKYDYEHDTIETASYDSSGSLILRHIYNYTNMGKRIEFVQYDSAGSVVDRQIDIYNDLGDVIESLYYNAEGSLLVRGVYNYQEYDDEGNWIKRIVSGDVVPPGEDKQEGRSEEHRTITYYGSPTEQGKPQGVNRQARLEGLLHIYDQTQGLSN